MSNNHQITAMSGTDRTTGHPYRGGVLSVRPNVSGGQYGRVRDMSCVSIMKLMAWREINNLLEGQITDKIK